MTFIILSAILLVLGILFTAWFCYKSNKKKKDDANAQAVKNKYSRHRDGEQIEGIDDENDDSQKSIQDEDAENKRKAAPGSTVPLKSKKKKGKKKKGSRKRKNEDEEDRVGNAVEGIAAIGAMHVGAAGLAGAVAARGQMGGDDDGEDNQLANEDAGAILDGAADDGGAVDGFFDLGLAD